MQACNEMRIECPRDGRKYFLGHHQRKPGAVTYELLNGTLMQNRPLSTRPAPHIRQYVAGWQALVIARRRRKRSRRVNAIRVFTVRDVLLSSGAEIMFRNQA